MNSIFHRFACLGAVLIPALVPLSTSAQTGSQKASAVDSASPVLPGWELVFSDEFNTPGEPNPSKWNYEEGYLRNGERQFYTNNRRENARVEKGMLVIEARKDGYDVAGRPKNRSQKTADYTSASVTTWERASWTYVRLEVCAKFPQGTGMWPAIWAMGVNIHDLDPNTGKEVGWPACGEIDMMEYYGNLPSVLTHTVHYGVTKGKHYAFGSSIPMKNVTDDFHVYAVERYPERVDFFYDGKKTYSFPVDKAGEGPENPFRKPYYLILNLALGGSMGGHVDDSALPRQYLVDYVRVYKPKAP